MADTNNNKSISNNIDFTSKYLKEIEKELKILPFLYDKEKYILFYIKCIFLFIIIFSILIFIVYSYNNYILITYY